MFCVILLYFVILISYLYGKDIMEDENIYMYIIYM